VRISGKNTSKNKQRSGETPAFVSLFVVSRSADNWALKQRGWTVGQNEHCRSEHLYEAHEESKSWGCAHRSNRSTARGC
jgi:hypothetical protein